MRSLSNRTDLAQITKRLRLVQPSDRAQWGLMNAAEMICHIRGAFLMAMGEIDSGPMRLILPRAIMKLVALRSPIPWSKNFGTVSALKQRSPAVLVSSFPTDRESALAALDRFCHLEQRRVDHPFMGTMSFREWMRWGYLHTDHHLRQFRR